MSRLNMIGNMIEMEPYVHELSVLIKRLDLESSVRMFNIQGDSQWKTFYKNSSVFVSMSEHEGFFVPALECNYFELPMIAYDAGAVADTLGNAGLITKNKSPEVVAELINKVVTDDELRKSIIENGKQNYQRFKFENLEDRFYEIIQKFLSNK